MCEERTLVLFFETYLDEKCLAHCYKVLERYVFTFVCIIKLRMHQLHRSAGVQGDDVARYADFANLLICQTLDKPIMANIAEWIVHLIL